MLARSLGSRLNHNAENPGGHLHHKTPARPVAGKSAAPPATAGKGALQNTARSGRVLGAKDRNLAKGSDQAGQDSTGLLFPGAKPSTSQAQAGPSSCAPRPAQQQQQPFKTPLPNKTLRRLAPQDLRTPATALRPKRAPPLELDSPDVSMEADAEQQPVEPQEEEDREVEYAGASARDYGALLSPPRIRQRSGKEAHDQHFTRTDEPYVPDWDEPDYKTAGIGAALRAIPWGKLGDVDEWLQQEELERRMFKATLDDEIPAPAYLHDQDDADQPMFPLPKVRAPLAGKSRNQVGSPATSTRPRPGAPAPGNAGLSASNARKQLGASAAARLPMSAGPNRPRPPLSQTSSQSSLRASALQRSSAQASSTMMPPPSMTRKPLTSQAIGGSSSAARLASSTNSAPIRPTRPRLAPTGLGRAMSSPAVTMNRLGGPAQQQGSSVSAAQLAANRRAELDAAEKALGAFGIVDSDSAGIDALLSELEDDGLAARGFGDEALVPAADSEFRLDLDL
ncbi:hypothetical protein C6P46_006938 [Rhodotorula mucilaginosa]|uniref:Uncharacterized protein n=1 Tax=Rhodotorula mucilaginosa TaxID=5537 RepID=A0A9P6VW84_RHOMI|nr:hypothetical protein C6P46_006938 [Rhodotorula mucilaginosa]